MGVGREGFCFKLVNLNPFATNNSARFCRKNQQQEDLKMECSPGIITCLVGDSYKLCRWHPGRVPHPKNIYHQTFQVPKMEVLTYINYQRKFSGKLPIYELLGSSSSSSGGNSSLVVVVAVVVV